MTPVRIPFLCRLGLHIRTTRTDITETKTVGIVSTSRTTTHWSCSRAGCDKGDPL